MGTAMSTASEAVSQHCGAPTYTDIQLNSQEFVKFVLPEPSCAAFGVVTLPEPVKAGGSSSSLAVPQDLLVQLCVNSGSVASVYFAAQEAFPSRTRKLWTIEGTCTCEVADCDHAYPRCASKTTGVPCEACTDPERNYQHLSDKGKSLTGDPQAAGAMGSVRISASDSNLKAGAFFVSVVSSGDAGATDAGIRISQCVQRKEVAVRLGNRGGQ
jgi:hypothetical protein